MLIIKIPGTEFWNEQTGEFHTTKDQVLKMEHSLLSVYKWEAKYHKSFLSTRNKTNDEIEYYFQCMTKNQDVDPMAFKCLTPEQIVKIKEYIEDPMTATTINRRSTGNNSRQIITAEIIYYWMVSFGIPLEFEKRHLNHLLRLIDVCDIKNSPSKKQKRSDTARQYRQMNAARKAGKR